jgi:hypothetical protein
VLPKSGGGPRECEDSIAIDIARGRFAIADGATEGFDSRRWARYLTRAWVSASSGNLAPGELPECVRALGQRLARRWAGHALPWYLEDKAHDGAFAAFLGVELTTSGTWSAVALGDTCLVIERGGRIAHSFPLASADEFSNRPMLVASRGNGDDTRERMRVGRGECLAGDVLLLMSDAIACWYLGHATANRDQRDAFHGALPEPASFSSFVARERAARRLRNDDVAVVKLVFGAAASDGH